MSQPPKVFRKNYLDLSYSIPSIGVTDGTATNDGSSFLNFLRNRDNESGWATTGSNDAANTQLEIEFVDTKEFNTIILVKHNFKSFSIQYYDVDTSSYVDFSTAINESNNTDSTSEFYFTDVFSPRIRIIITGCQTVDADKTLSQLIVTQRVGQFVGWPIFRSPRIDRSRKRLEALSGKSHVIERVGKYETRLEFRQWPEDSDMSLLEQMFFYLPQGFLFWPCGGDESQFRYLRQGFRLQDIYHCKCINEWEPEWDRGFYTSGINISVSLSEAI